MSEFLGSGLLCRTIGCELIMASINPLKVIKLLEDTVKHKYSNSTLTNAQEIELADNLLGK